MTFQTVSVFDHGALDALVPLRIARPVVTTIKLMPKRAVLGEQLPLISELPAPHPFLKWVGGKGQLLDQLRPLMPPMYGRYFEPFVGGAALFFALRPPRATLSDINEELIDCYRTVRDDVEGVLSALQLHRYDQAHYYAVRDLDPKSLSLTHRAARTIFLNKTGFNGLYRVNREGKFNVPFGRHSNPNFCDERNLRSCSLALKEIELQVCDFRTVVANATKDDFVYFDPPYVPVSETADFTSYAAGGFSIHEQQELADAFRFLTKKGVYAMLSNSDTPVVRELYDGFEFHSVQASRNVNSNAARRGKVAEVVVRNYAPLAGGGDRAKPRRQ